MDEQRAQAHWNARRAVYVEFLGVVGAQLGHGIPFGVRQQPDHGAASRAMLLLELEGPDAVTRAGRVLAEASPRGQRQAPGGEEAFTAAREAFLTAARHALS